LNLLLVYDVLEVTASCIAVRPEILMPSMEIGV